MSKKTPAAPRRSTPTAATRSTSAHTASASRPKPKESRNSIKPQPGAARVTSADIPGTAQHAQRELRRQAGPAPQSRGIRVQAIKDGYFGHSRRRVGDVFTIKTEQEFSRKWMRRIDATTPGKVTTPNEVIRQKHDETLALKYGSRDTGATQSPDDPAFDEGDEDEDNPLGAD